MPSRINQWIVNELAQRLDAMDHALLVDFTGLSAQDADALRARLGEAEAGMLVVKNSLTILALRQLERLDVADLVDGPTAFIYGGDNPVALAKAVAEWSKGHRGVPKIRGAMLEGQALDADAAKALATLPPVQVLQGQVVGVLAAPLSGLLTALSGTMRGFAAVLNAQAQATGDSAD
ncbi:MAG: 50S ribosomal protein L10 [Planctomycetota bacterium]